MNNMNNENKQIIEYSQPIQIEISTNAKGQHQWIIKLSGDNIDYLFHEAVKMMINYRKDIK